MEQLEIEVKFYLPDLESVRNRIIALGADCCQERALETNIRFEDVPNSLIRQNVLLRLRQDTKATLTYKSQPTSKDAEFKVLNELEVVVSNFDTTKLILERLGFHPEQVYEKWRETYRLRDTLLCLDGMPFGNFLEIEGDRHQIKRLVDELGLAWPQRITLNYLAMFERIRSALDLGFADVTFENFKQIQIDGDILRRLIQSREQAA